MNYEFYSNNGLECLIPEGFKVLDPPPELNAMSRDYSEYLSIQTQMNSTQKARALDIICRLPAVNNPTAEVQLIRRGQASPDLNGVEMISQITFLHNGQKQISWWFYDLAAEILVEISADGQFDECENDWLQILKSIRLTDS